MTERLKTAQVAPGAYQAMQGLSGYVKDSSIELSLRELVKVRASYMNGCAYCIDMHTKDARAAGETEARLYAVPVWHETPFFTPRERAALAWTEAVTDVAGSGVPDEAWTAVRAEFSEREVVDLTMAVVEINAWNRIAIAFRAEPGSYQPPASHGSARSPASSSHRHDFA
jgi:AhpD family alkylhydroperoxidase